MIIKYCVTGVRFYNASMTNSSGILNLANRDSRSVTAICEQTSHPVALSTRCLWCGRAFKPRTTGGSSEVLLHGTPTGILDRGASLDDASDRRGPTLGRLLEGVSHERARCLTRHSDSRDTYQVNRFLIG
jgi:hypothetical protein